MFATPFAISMGKYRAPSRLFAADEAAEQAGDDLHFQDPRAP